ncbi:MAG: glycosyl hydrolase family 26 [Lutibacter sp.]|uniref:glycosyl hydrolase n=1 Tax=Lutibacter sp. TaxID=1925666 RepID=UPI0019EC68E3|nr:glycosyl hydrolase [Lutibacter sp.]NOR27363.1 glycosyl hydrolase family 26 [Lutibacter sp.]
MKFHVFFFLVLATSLIFAQQSYKPINEEASLEVQQLLKDLYELKGKNIISGHHNYSHHLSKWHTYVKSNTGKLPLIWGTDLNRYYNEETINSIVKEAIKRNSEGYIVTLMWHTGRPQDNPPFNWNNSTQGELTKEEWKDLITPGTLLNKKWESRVDSIASHLKKLQNANVPILWRPYHEMNGSWFWWGDKKGADGYIKLWKMMYNRFVNYHKLNNLIWVWNANAPRDKKNDEAYDYDFYFPGVNYVDVLAADVYHNDYKQTHHDDLLKLGKGKLIALGEVGEVPSPQILNKQPMWSWFMIWDKWAETHNTPKQIIDVYNYPRTKSHK